MTSRLVCAGCGAEVPRGGLPFRCAHAGEGDVDHVLRRELDLSRSVFPAGDGDPNPFIRYRQLFHAWHLGLPDDQYCGLVRKLDTQVAEVDGHGFETTPFARADALSDHLGFSADGGVWVKDETGNVSGSHKARHLFGVLVYLEVAERLGLYSGRPELAIASCGNAALAAAVVARAGERTLRVFVPVDADPLVLERLEALGALVEQCPRQPSVPGDPTVHRLEQALANGALPFTCQGNLNGLAIEGGQTLAYELVSQGPELDRLVVQVGGGALASACVHGFREAVALGAIARSPRIDTVQTEGAWPLRRAYLLLGDGAIEDAAHHRSDFMWPWEEEPRSVAHGILDDETYDWLAVAEGMRATGGTPLVVDERTLRTANAVGAGTTGIPVDPTGSSGLAGLFALRAQDAVGDDERVAVLFTGVARTPTTERNDDEELRGAGHPVPEGLRAG